MALTDVKCRSAKAGPARLKLSDGGGLQFWVQTNGARLWQFAYRFGGKQKQLSFGPYPEVSLLEARGKRDDARRKLRDGICGLGEGSMYVPSRPNMELGPRCQRGS